MKFSKFLAISLLILSIHLLQFSSGKKDSSESGNKDSWEDDFKDLDMDFNWDRDTDWGKAKEPEPELKEQVEEIHERYQSEMKGQMREFPGSGGGNTAGFNETCRVNGKQCDTSYTRLACSQTTNRCICDDPSYAYAPEVKKCLTVAQQSQNWFCEYPSQCMGSALGQHSNCQRKICVCWDWWKQSDSPKDVRLVNDRCYLVKVINETCTSNEECDLTLEGHAICVRELGTGRRSCQCAPNNFWEPFPLNECLPKLEGDPTKSLCKADSQCKGTEMGQYSRCQKKSPGDSQGQCECFDHLHYPPLSTVYYKGICYIKKGMDDDCISDLECKAGIHQDAVCREHPSFLPGEKVCKCAEGKTCSGSNSNFHLNSGSILYLALFATIAKCLFA